MFNQCSGSQMRPWGMIIVRCTLQTYSASAVIMRGKLFSSTLELSSVGQVTCPANHFFSTTLIFPCYNVVLRKSLKRASISQRKNRSLTQYTFRTLDIFEIFILHITNEPDGSKGYIISINWQPNQPETTTKENKIYRNPHRNSKLQKCDRAPQHDTNITFCFLSFLRFVFIILL